MRSFLIIFTIPFIIMSIMVMSGQNIYAAGNEKLPVDIRIYSGESVLVREDTPFYSSVPVTFTPECEGGDCYYSICTDDTDGFGAYVKMDTACLTLYPDDTLMPCGSWKVRFKASADDKETESSVYNVIFDDTAPSMETKEPFDVNRGSTVHFDLHDDRSGICRIVTKCNDIVTDEVHYDRDSIQNDRQYMYTLSDAAASSHIEIECFDLAGNHSVISFEYLCDESIPQIQMEGIEDGAHENHGKELTITASDPDSDVTMDYVTERRIGDELITTEVSNAPETETVSFDDDGEYLIKAWAVDSAGNRSEEISRRFVIDTKAPVIDIEGVSDGVDLRSAAAVTINVSENIRKDSAVDISLTRSAMGITEDLPVSSYELQAENDSRTVNIISDGEYELAVSAVDGAGNRSDLRRGFRIDTKAPDISVSGLNEGEVTSQKPVIRFSAGEMFYESTVLSTILEKQETGGFRRVKSTDMVMRSAQDHIDVEVEDEGRYRLTCIAADRSGNTSQSSIGFAVDMTPPVIASLADIDNKYFRSFTLPKAVASLVTDASAVMTDVFVNDSRISNEDVIIEEGKYRLTILTEDEAGNASEDSAEFIVDHTSPQIVVSGVDREGNIRKGRNIGIGLVEDCDRLVSVSFNGRNIAIKEDNTADIAVDDYGEYDLEITAEDPAGNVTDTQIHTSCYMVGRTVDEYLKGGRTITVSEAAKDKDEFDPAALAVGLVSVLGGTFGLTFRGAFADRE